MATNKFKDFIDTINKDTGTFEVELHGVTVRVKNYLTMQERIDYVNTVEEYIDATGLCEKYNVALPIILDIVNVSFYTDIKLPKEMDKAQKFINELGIKKVLDDIEEVYLVEMDARGILKNKYIKSESSFDKLIDNISDFVKKYSDAIPDISKEDIAKAMKAIGSVDKNDWMNKVLEANYGGV